MHGTFKGPYPVGTNVKIKTAPIDPSRIFEPKHQLIVGESGESERGLETPEVVLSKHGQPYFSDAHL